MRSFLAPFFLAVALIAAVGCGGGGNPMVGTWKMDFSEDFKSKMGKEESAEIVAEFKADNTFTVKVDVMGRKDEISGTYELKDKALTMHQKMESGKPSNETQTATLSDDLKSFTAPGMESMGKMEKQ